MNNEEKLLKETNKVLNELAMSCRSFDEYQAQTREYLETLGIQPLTAKSLKRYYDHFSEKYSRHEKHICDVAKRLVATNDNITVTPEQKARMEINDIGESIAKGPHLTILDGGPGAGKSFSLGKSMDAAGAPVICLGATESAAAGLYGDMAKISREHAEKGEKSVPVLGGLTVDQFLNPRTSEEKIKRNKIDMMFRSDPKPILMVDESGLLGHKEMDAILNHANMRGVKIILAGDSQQIPPEKGQPFKILAESLKDTPAYVNAPYVFRQGDFIDKAITSGVYHGNNSDQPAISTAMAVEFMIAAYDVGDPKFSDRTYTKDGKEKEFTFKQYMQEKYAGMDKAAATAAYVGELSGKAQDFFGGSKEKILAALKAGPSAEQDENGHLQYDKYVCAALMCQTMGIQAYDLRGKIRTEDNAADAAALDFAENYMKSLEEGRAKRQNKENKTAQKEGRAPVTVGFEYPDGKLAITATKEEAKELNMAIRRKMGKTEPLTEGEPIILADGKRMLATRDQAENPPAGFAFAYALDVTTTQGMSQNGKVTMIVSKETQNNLQGGEILVGATRHKGDFEIRISADADKDKFFKDSEKQFAAVRIKSSEFVPDLYLAAKGDEQKAGHKQAKAEQNRSASAKGIHRHLMSMSAASSQKQQAAPNILQTRRNQLTI